MVESLIARGASFILALGASSSGMDALSQTKLQDPTKPPSVLAAEPPPGAERPVAASKLQSVLLSPGRKLAVIDGQTVALGGRIGEATVVAISPSEVTLKRGQQLETLKLYPDTQVRRAEAK